MFKAMIVVFVFACASSYAQQQVKKTPTEDWSTRCKPIEEAIEDLSRSKKYDAKSIKKLFELNSKIQKCDDASYAEGMTDITVRSLVQDFDSVVRTAKQKDLQAFILRHINSTADWADLDKVAVHASKDCPTESKSFCEKVKVASSSASKEAQEN